MFKNLKQYRKRMVYNPNISRFMKKSLQNSRILSKNLSIANDKNVCKRNTNVYVDSNDSWFCAGNIIAPNLLQKKGSYVVFDTDVCKKYGECFLKMQYTYNLKITDLYHYNPFKHCTNSDDVSIIANAFTEATCNYHDIDKLEYLSYFNFYLAIMGYVYESCPDDKKNLRSVAQIIEEKDVINKLEAWGEQANVNIFKNAYNSIKNMPAAKIEEINHNCYYHTFNFSDNYDYYPNEDNLNLTELFVKDMALFIDIRDSVSSVLGIILYVQLSKIFIGLSETTTNFKHLDFYINCFDYFYGWFPELELNVIHKEYKFNCILCADKSDMNDFDLYSERFISSCDTIISYNSLSELYNGYNDKCYCLDDKKNFIETDLSNKKYKAFILTRGLNLIIDDIFGIPD